MKSTDKVGYDYWLKAHMRAIQGDPGGEKSTQHIKATVNIFIPGRRTSTAWDHHGISILFAALVLLLEEEMRKLDVRRTSLLQLTRWTPR